jgi:hypothetical protein
MQGVKALIGLAVPGRPIGSWLRRTGAPEGSAPEPDRTPSGPRWVRVATVAHGHQRSPTVASGPEGLQVADRPVYAAGMTQVGDSDWSRRSEWPVRGSRRAATDRRRDQHDRWRTVADRRMARALIPSFTCRFLTILPGLYPFDVQAGRGSLDLTRKGPEVQLLPRPPHPS